MIECRVCGAPNSDLALTCTQCKSYLQAKVDTLDLFATSWGIIESPAKTFRRVVLSKRKNYIVFLSVLMGIGAAVTATSYQNLGPVFGGLPGVAGVVLIGGVALGLLGVPFAAMIAVAVARLVGGRTNVRSVMAVLVYAWVPAVAILIAVVPIKLAIFGAYLFDHNPSPMVIAPGLYGVLAGLEAVGALWSLILMGVGMSVATGLRGLRPMLLALVTGSLAAGMMWALRYLRLS
jgi:hypothetical protein